jgi:hypothetical protein
MLSSRKNRKAAKATPKVDEAVFEFDEFQRSEMAKKLNWLRAGVLGANDGIVSTAGLVMGIAGAGGDASKKIYCYNMQPELISIAGNYWLSDNLQGDYWGKPVCIGLQDGQLMMAELF